MTYLTNLAAVYFEQKDYTKSIELCTKAIEVGRENRADFKIIAKAFTRMGNSYKKLKVSENHYTTEMHAQYGWTTFDSTLIICCRITPMPSSILKSHYPNSVLLIPRRCYRKWKVCCAKSRGKRTSIQRLQNKRRRKETSCSVKVFPLVQLNILPFLNAYSLLVSSGQYAEALKCYSEAIKRNPSDAKVYSNRAACYTKLAAFDLGLKDCETCLELEPGFGKRNKKTCHKWTLIL